MPGYVTSTWVADGATAPVVVFFLLLGAALGLLWMIEVRLPRRIAWREVVHQGIRARRADALVLQCESPGVVWASSGYGIYRSVGGAPFERLAVIRPRFGEAWAGYLKSLRRRYGYLELVELQPVGDHAIVALAAGDVYRLDLVSGRIDRTHRLRYFGRGAGRGLMAFGIASDREGSIYYAEYPRSGAVAVGLWCSRDEGRSWGLVAEFPPGFVRHLHAVQVDPVDGGIWIASGDRDEECRIGVSTDGGATFTWIGEGTQEFRACSLLFFPNAVMWGTDADLGANHAVSFDRGTGTSAVATALPGTTFYAQVLGSRIGLLGIAGRKAEVWVARSDGTCAPWLDWGTREPEPDRPPAGVRLARGAPSDPTVVHLNPLRTVTDEAAIFRVPRAAIPAVEGRPVADTGETVELRSPGS